jgi:predicted ribosome quality control (RQC) complex YloA/Tae2 family protein
MRARPRSRRRPRRRSAPTLMRRLEGAARRAARREERLEDELAALEAPDALRRIGDLILARYHEIPPGPRACG